jgi:TetR/AcrR family transcriptional regulator
MVLAAPKRLSFDQREKRLLQAAGRLFSRLGYRGTTTKAIAREAGINEALLFRHFPNKETLYDALLNQAVSDWSQETLISLKEYQKKPLRQALVEIGQLLIRRVEADPDLLRMVTFASLENHRLRKGFFKNPPPIKSFMKAFFAERQRRGEIKKEDPSLLAATFLSLIFYYIHMKEILGAEKYYYGAEKPTLNFFSKIISAGVKP